MAAANRSSSHPLTVERIVDAACLIIERDGLRGLSMRKLGAHLDVDPMAVYHHVADKRELLALVTTRTIGAMVPPDPTAAWDVRTRQWAIRYWELVVENRELTLAGLADPDIAAGGLPSTEPLLAAIADSGLRGRPHRTQRLPRRRRRPRRSAQRRSTRPPRQQRRRRTSHRIRGRNRHDPGRHHRSDPRQHIGIERVIDRDRGRRFLPKLCG